MSEPELDTERLLAILADHGVKYVLVGGMAAIVHGSPYVTFDVDVVPERTEDNLRRLSDALRAMNARVWTQDEPGGVTFGHSARTLGESSVWNLVTDHGRLDLTFVPSGTQGFEDLMRDAVSLTILGVPTLVASLGDVIRSKEAAGREKDRVVLPILRRLLDHQELDR